jgi:hypothetical protein
LKSSLESTFTGLIKNKLTWIVLIAGVICVGQLFRYLHINLDDKYILYKYAINLVNGNGFTYNPGEPVEGFSSFLFVVLCALVYWILGITGTTVNDIISMVWIGRIISLLCTLGTIIYVARLLKDIFQYSNRIILVSLLFIVLRADLMFHMLNGMESGLFIFLLTAVTYHLFAYTVSDFSNRRHLFTTMILTVLLSLARPDSMVYTGSLLAIWGFFTWYNTGSFKTAAGKGLILLMPLAFTTFIYIIFRLWYFGDIFPNTYYSKVPGFSEKVVVTTWWFADGKMKNFFQQTGIVTRYYVWSCLSGILILAAALTATRIGIVHFKRKIKFLGIVDATLNKKSGFRRGHFTALALAWLLVGSAYVVYVGGDWMPGFRFIAHFMVIPSVLIISEYLQLTGLFIEYFKKDRAVSFLFLVLFLITIGFHAYRLDGTIHQITRGFFENANSMKIPEYHSFYYFRSNLPEYRYFTMYHDTARDIKTNTPAGDTIAFYEAGCLSLLLGDQYYLVDIGGLNDRVISRNNHGEGFYSMNTGFYYFNCGPVRGEKDRYIIDQNPTYILFNSFAVFCNPVPGTILGGRYALTDEFDRNGFKFFTIYRRVADE